MWADVNTVDRAAAPRCDCCGLRQLACACECLGELSLPFSVKLILHPNEFKRPTSTSRFLSMYPEVSLSHYDRLSLQEGDATPFLLFPSTQGTNTSALKLSDHLTLEETEPYARMLNERGLVVVDGTWQECRKMVRQSRLLQQLERIELTTSSKSAYPFRKNQIDGGLSTAEAIAELAAMLYNRAEVGARLQHFFEHAKASQNGHRILC